MVGAINGYQSASLLRVLGNNRSQMEDLTVQLGSSKKAQSYGGLGAQVGRSLDLRSEISTIDGYRSTIQQMKLQISMMNQTLQRITDIGSKVSGSATATEYNITADKQSVAQMTAKTHVQEILGLLDAEVDGDYVFAGTKTDSPPTLNYDQIVNGFDGKDGLLTVTNERIRADAGADGMGRLTTATVGASTTLTEQATDFGYKLSSVSSTLSNVTVAGPAGSPASLSLDVTGPPVPNEVLNITLNLPDGTSEVISLRAKDGVGSPAEGTFSINGSNDDIATSIKAALDQQIKKNVTVEGEAASRLQGAMDFYMTSGGGEPKRVVGNPPETATTLDTATAAGKPTVEWYVGENGTGSARDTAKGLIDKGVNTSYGARANEDGIARQLAYLTAFSLPTYDGDSNQDKARYGALADSVSGGLASNHQGAKVSTIQIELGMATKSIADADSRHQTASSLLKTMSDDVDGIDKEEVAAKLMTLNSTMEAAYQATSMIYKMSLTKFI